MLPWAVEHWVCRHGLKSTHSLTSWGHISEHHDSTFSATRSDWDNWAKCWQSLDHWLEVLWGLQVLFGPPGKREKGRKRNKNTHCHPLPTCTYPIYSRGKKETVGHLIGEQCSLLAFQSSFFSVVFYEGPVSCLTSNLARPLTSFLKPTKSAESILLFKMLFQVKTITECHNW